MVLSRVLCAAVLGVLDVYQYHFFLFFGSGSVCVSPRPARRLYVGCGRGKWVFLDLTLGISARLYNAVLVPFFDLTSLHVARTKGVAVQPSERRFLGEEGERAVRRQGERRPGAAPSAHWGGDDASLQVPGGL